MDTNRYPLLLGACAVALVTGCAQTGTQLGAGQAGVGQAAPRAKVEPVYRVQQPVGTAAGQYAVGRIDLAEGRHETAIRRFKAALQLDPTFVEAHNGLGVAYGQVGRFAEAAEAFRAALASGPAQAHVLNNLGFAQLKAGQLDEAWTSLRRSYDLEPANAKTRENLVLLAEARRLAAQRSVAPPVAAAATSAPSAIAAVAPSPVAVGASSSATAGTPSPVVTSATAPVVISEPERAEPAPIAASTPIEFEPAPIVASAPVEFEPAPIAASTPVEFEPAPIAASAPVEFEPAPIATSVPVEFEPAPVVASAPVEFEPAPIAASEPTERAPEPPSAVELAAMEPAPAPAVVVAPPAEALVAAAQASAAKLLGEKPNPAAYEVVISKTGDAELVQLSANVYELRSNAVAIAAPVPAVVAKAPAAHAPFARSAPVHAANAQAGTPVSAAMRAPAAREATPTAPAVAVAPVRTYRVEARVATLPDVPAVRPAAFSPQAEGRVLALPPRQSLKQVAGLEVSNAVGLRSLAGRTARQLERFGASVARVSDFRVFGKGRTEVHYLPGHLESAKVIRERLPVDAELVKVSKMHPGVNVRLVVGRDMVVGPIAWWGDDLEAADSVTMARAVQVAPPSIGIAPVPAEPLVIAAPPGVDLKPFAAKVARANVEDGWRHL